MAGPNPTPPELRVRRAGSGRTTGGDQVWWSVAEGGKGRRWRETVVWPAADGGQGGLRHSLLLETSPDGRFSHLELSTPAGLLTLHPERDGTLHGNAIGRDGVQHVRALPWDADGLVLVDGSAIAGAAAAHLLASEARSRTARRRRVLRISWQLRLEVGAELVESPGAGRWRLDGRSDTTITADADGLPVLAAAATWPLELPE